MADRKIDAAPAWWAPERYRARRPHLLERARIAAATRAFFQRRGFVEVETPALQVSPGLEPHLQAFATAIRDPGFATPRRLYLHTSPEFAMKKLLAAGERRIFQLARTFRNGERGALHHPEFTMLEWYRAEPDAEALIQDCRDLLAGVLSSRMVFHRGAAACDPHLPIERLSVAEAFSRHAGIDLMASLADPLAPDLAPLARAAAGIGIAAHPGDRWEDLFFRIFLDRIEPRLGLGRPTILCDYPVAMAALARAKPGDPGLADRIELYVAGVELANGFVELTDATEQRRRFASDMDLKEQLYGERYPIDEDFLNALASGFPPSAGIALGFDRLVMLACGAERIEDVLWAPVAAREGQE